MNSFLFVDLFAGMGGFHLALHQLGGGCVYASEIDSFARKTYEANFKNISPSLFEKNLFRGDITLDENQECILCDVDILCAGFPCQAFSIAGLQKGFSDSRGTLFFEIAKILKNKQPKSFLLENVRHLLKHDDGKTFDVIYNILTKELNYTVYYKIIKASDHGLPTFRPRVYIVGFRHDIEKKGEFKFPDPSSLKFTMSDVFEGKCSREIGKTITVGGRGSGINDKRNWDAYLVDGQIKVLTSKEAKKMMGYPSDFVFPVSNTQALKQLGNTIAIDPVKAIASNILKIIK